jgi:L-ascorbate metabolism protein UlaG (beta-lactamase superfamily)
MEIIYYGANCVKLQDSKKAIIVDDNLSKLGLKKATTSQDIVVVTGQEKPKDEGAFLINGPGEYEISEVSIRGIAAKSHVDEDGFGATIYSVKIDDFSIGILGHIDSNLSDNQLEELGVIDVLVVPIGGHGYTLDAEEAVSIIRKVEPKIIIPTHYSDKDIKYEVPQADVADFLKAAGISEPEYCDSFVLKEKEIGDKTRTIILKRREVK